MQKKKKHVSEMYFVRSEKLDFNFSHYFTDVLNHLLILGLVLVHEYDQFSSKFLRDGLIPRVNFLSGVMEIKQYLKHIGVYFIM